MPRRPRRMSPAFAATLAVLWVAGCATDADTSDPAGRSLRLGTDPAAERLHDVCGSLLLFHAQYGRLAGDLEELALATGLDDETLTDPRTGRPFAYEPDGFASGAGGRRIVVLAAPEPGASHRWGVTIVPGGSMMTGKVVALPVGAFADGDPSRSRGPEAGGG